ncbi:hypothetical protein K466DRAFT_569306 [Polyporus arcularius HHB13444]|uniref:Uncharacterized protein n=1 Tax=Polyporus arcularius HHB13444 TaxID=1314778 RepID=A0A5C3NVD8_9APHY|nr:hypothetical protein K466DRAFT_569306 [Polyporus arcularius HHB13444]
MRPSVASVLFCVLLMGGAIAQDSSTDVTDTAPATTDSVQPTDTDSVTTTIDSTTPTDTATSSADSITSTMITGTSAPMTSSTGLLGTSGTILPISPPSTDPTTQPGGQASSRSTHPTISHNPAPSSTNGALSMWGHEGLPVLRALLPVLARILVVVVVVGKAEVGQYK